MPRSAWPASDPAYQAGGIALLLALASILGALAFEHLWGLEPCPLCLQQRYAYYAGVPALFLALVLVAADRPRLAMLLFVAVALIFLANAAVGVYHAGVEWKFWLGPDTCSQPTGDLKPLGKALIDRLEKARVVRCDVAPWRFLGISLAGWNAAVSLLITLAALQAATAARMPRSAG
ncbi:MAG: disulfide bond formation protein B [Hyphomicrobiaceae bacterium]|nr:disulfide bond formation protein B [Hyphomicrobiaceae bacterium]